MIKLIKQFLKGAVIGVANIIPGVSGGTMAVSMGIYDKIIHSVTHIISEFKESMKCLIPIAVGAVFGIGVLAFVIEAMFTNIPVQTNMLFIGLIVGGMPVIINRLKATGKKVNAGHIAAMVIFFALVVGLACLGEREDAATDITVNAVNMIKLFGVGIIASATMVIPGVSGSMVMMLLGYYNSIISTISGFIQSVFAMDMGGIMHGVMILCPFGVGVLLGIVVIAKLVELLFVKAPNYAYCAIIGLIIASPFAIVITSDISAYNVLSVSTGVIALIIGYFCARKLGEE